MIGESLSGLVTIRCLEGAEEHFGAIFEERHNANLRAFFAFLSCARWIGFRLDLICVVLLGAACYLAVVFHHYLDFGLDPAIVGLALMLLIQLSGLFQWSVRQSAESENLMISVERVLEFTEIPVERPEREEGDSEVEKTGWIKEGRVQFDGVDARLVGGSKRAKRARAKRSERERRRCCSPKRERLLASVVGAPLAPFCAREQFCCPRRREGYFALAPKKGAAGDGR
jgi:hypothetical protein